jgi:hypothetical protein
MRSQSIWGRTAALLQILLSCHGLRGERLSRTQTEVRQPALLLFVTVTVTVSHAYCGLKLNYYVFLSCNSSPL